MATAQSVREFYELLSKHQEEVYAHPGARDDLAAALRRGELPVTNELIQSFHPDGDWVVNEQPGQVFHGRSGIVRILQAWYDVMDEWRTWLDGVNQVGERFIARARVTARGRKSGVDAVMGGGVVVGYRDGLIFEWREFTSLDEALAYAENAGAPEQLSKRPPR
jgi:SnoaL-like domain